MNADDLEEYRRERRRQRPRGSFNLPLTAGIASIPLPTWPPRIASASEIVHALIPFVTGGTAACVAETATIPIDTAKVKLQLRDKSSQEVGGMMSVMRKTVKADGFRALFRGLVAGCQRQLVFATLRLGLFEHLRDFFSGGGDGQSLSLGGKLMAGFAAAAIGITAANPMDLVKIRSQADNVKPYKYKSTLQVYRSIVQAKGFGGLWSGYFVNLARNATVAAVEISTYETVKPILISRGMPDSTPCHLLSAVACAAMATLVACPLDVLRARVMSSSDKYSGMVDCAVTTVRNEGFFAFYKGSMPLFYRIAGWNIVMFVTFEQLKRLSYYLLAD